LSPNDLDNYLANETIPDMGLGVLADYEEKAKEFARIDLECVPKLFYGKLDKLDSSIFETESVLGGATIEGVVIKNYNLFDPQGNILMAKYVSDKFKEAHKVEWSTVSPLLTIHEMFATEARWRKSIQHLEEKGELEHSPRDIGKLLNEIVQDVLEEESDTIKDILFNYYLRDIKKEITRGFPEWYKEFILEN
jgi:hypothetical protein